MKWTYRLYIGIWMVMSLLFVGCSDTGEVSYRQKTESNQVTGTENMDALIQYVVKDTLSKNCYQAFYGYVSKLKDAEWTGFQLVDLDGDKTDELIAQRIKEGKLCHYVMDWADQKITVTEMEPFTEIFSDKTINDLEYFDKDYMLVILSAEGENYFEGVTKKEKDFFHLVVGIVWIEEGWADAPQEKREAMEDYFVLSELGENTDYIHDDGYYTRTLFQYRMRTKEVTEVYKDVFQWEREYSPDHDSSSEIGVRNESDGYLYGHNENGWADYAEITKIERSESELVIQAIVKNVYTENLLADVKIFMTPNDGKYGYELQGYEVARDNEMDPESGQKLEEFQAENLWIQYYMQASWITTGATPVIKTLRYMENDKEQFAANAKHLLTELKKEYEANPGRDGSNVAAKSTLLGAYEFAEGSKILIYEDAVYGNVPPETGEGSEYGYYVNYCLLTPGNLFSYGEIYRYNESFGDMPVNRNGTSRCRHYFLGCDSSDLPAIDEAYVAHTADFAEELMFYAEVGRSHDMTWDEEGWENYDEDSYVYGAYFRPDGTRIINQYDTWRIATMDYFSYGAFIKIPNGTTLFEQGVGDEGYEYYVEGKKLTLDKKAEDTVDTICDITIDATTKLVGQILYWNWEGCVNVDLVFNIGGVEVHHHLFYNKIYW